MTFRKHSSPISNIGSSASSPLAFTASRARACSRTSDRDPVAAFRFGGGRAPFAIRSRVRGMRFAVRVRDVGANQRNHDSRFREFFFYLNLAISFQPAYRSDCLIGTQAVQIAPQILLDARRIAGAKNPRILFLSHIAEGSRMRLDYPARGDSLSRFENHDVNLPSNRN